VLEDAIGFVGLFGFTVFSILSAILSLYRKQKKINQEKTSQAIYVQGLFLLGHMDCVPRVPSSQKSFRKLERRAAVMETETISFTTSLFSAVDIIKSMLSIASNHIGAI
jgi:hypothetical protein